MDTQIFCLGVPNVLQTPQPLTFPCHPKPLHGFGCRSLKPRWHKGRELALKCGGGDRLMRPESKRNEKTDEHEFDAKEDVVKVVNEEMEQMEMEAIMGKDDGREPLDYKRRAGIFYKSSEMFQAIKDDHHQPHPCA